MAVCNILTLYLSFTHAYLSEEFVIRSRLCSWKNILTLKHSKATGINLLHQKTVCPLQVKHIQRN